MPPIKEREQARLERQLEKKKKKKRIAWIVIIVVFVILLAMKMFEINFNSIRNNIANNSGSISISDAADASAYPFAIDSSRVKVNAMGDRLNLLTESSVTMLNLNGAEVNYSFNHGYSNPSINCGGNYFCLVDQGSNRFRLDSIKENIYEMKTDKTVLCADVNRNGMVVYATQGDETKSTVFVINKNQTEKMKVDINDGYVVDVAIDNYSKRIAVATVNSKDAKLVTTVHSYTIGNTEPVSSISFVGTNLLDISFSNSSDLFVVGTNCVSVITNQKKQRIAFDVGEINTNCFGYTDDGELVIAYSKYDGAVKDTLAYINDAGKVKMTLELPSKAKYVSSASNNVTVLLKDKIVTYSLKKGKEKASVPCDESLTTANRLSSKIFVTRQQLVDVMG